MFERFKKVKVKEEELKNYRFPLIESGNSTPFVVNGVDKDLTKLALSTLNIKNKHDLRKAMELEVMEEYGVVMFDYTHLGLDPSITNYSGIFMPTKKRYDLSRIPKEMMDHLRLPLNDERYYADERKRFWCDTFLYKFNDYWFTPFIEVFEPKEPLPTKRKAVANVLNYLIANDHPNYEKRVEITKKVDELVQTTINECIDATNAMTFEEQKEFITYSKYIRDLYENNKMTQEEFDKCHMFYLYSADNRLKNILLKYVSEDIINNKENAVYKLENFNYNKY